MEETVIVTSTQDTHGDLAPASTSRIMPVAPSPTAPATSTRSDLAATTPSDLAATTPIDLATTTRSDPHAMSPNDPAAPSLSSTASSPMIIPGPSWSTVTPIHSEPYQRGRKTKNTVPQNTGSMLAECSESLAAIHQESAHQWINTGTCVSRGS